MDESFFSPTFKKVLKHEMIVCGKVSCFIFAIQLIFQLLPLQSPFFVILSWTIFPLAIIIACRSDMRFYTKSVDNAVRFERLCCNLIILLTSWISTISLFQYLNLPWNPENKNKNHITAEDEAGVLGPHIVLAEIIESQGFVKGLVMLLFAHFSAVVTVVSCVRSVVFGLENVLVKLYSYVPAGWMWKKKAEEEVEKKSE